MHGLWIWGSTSTAPVSWSPPRRRYVVLRRLLALVLAQKMGNFKLASHLEELPGDSALAELPDSIMTDLVSRLKTEAKLETFMK